VLISLSRALAVPVDYLLRQSELRVTHVEFRKRARTTAKGSASVEARVLHAVECYREVEDYLAIEGTWVAPSGFPRSVSTDADAEVAAGDLRDAWELGADPIPDLAALLEERRVKVLVIDLPEDVSGLHAEVAAGDAYVARALVVNERQSGERQRFTLAHELGHLILAVPDTKIGERLCHRFASAFLMPKNTMQAEVGPRRRAIPVRELFRLKQLFGVSAQAVAYRCHDLGFISKPVFASIFRCFAQKGWRQQEPGALQPEVPQRFERLVMRALAESVIGEAKAAELLGVSTWQLIDMLDSPPDEADDDVPARL